MLPVAPSNGATIECESLNCHLPLVLSHLVLDVLNIVFSLLRYHLIAPFSEWQNCTIRVKDEGTSIQYKCVFEEESKYKIIREIKCEFHTRTTCDESFDRVDMIFQQAMLSIVPKIYFNLQSNSSSILRSLYGK